MNQIKEKFLIRHTNDSGFFHSYPNRLVCGPYECTFGGQMHRGVFVNDKRLVEVKGSGYRTVRKGDKSYPDYDLSCAEKPFGYFRDPYTKCINRLVCAMLYGEVNMVWKARRKLIRGYYINDEPIGKYLSISTNKITVKDFNEDTGVTQKCVYDMSGGVQYISAHNKEGMPHDFNMEFAGRRIVKIGKYEQGVLIRNEKYTNYGGGDHPQKISVYDRQESNCTYIYDTDIQSYMSRLGIASVNDFFFMNVAVTELLNKYKLNPKLLPSKETINYLIKLSR
jgi:hypothetical protein